MKKQYEEWQIFWPLKYKRPSFETLDFDEKEKEKFNKIMKILVDLAAETYSKGNRFNACLLYDSKNDKILLTCCDNTKRESKL